MDAGTAYPVSNCVGAGRIEGWFWHSKDQVDEQGYGFVQSYCFEGDLVFYPVESQQLSKPSARSYKRRDPVTFEVLLLDGEHQAVNLILQDKDGEDYGFGDKRKTALPQGGTVDPKELVGGSRVEGVIVTGYAEANEQQWGHVVSSEFAGPVVFRLSENPILTSTAFDAGDAVSFELGFGTLWGTVDARQMRVTRRADTAAGAGDEDWAPRKKRKKKVAPPQGDDPWANVPRFLPISLFSGDDDGSNCDLVFAAYEELITNYETDYPGWDLVWLLKGLITEADELFENNQAAKTTLSRRLNGHSFFRNGEYDVRFEAKKNKMALQKKSAWLERNRQWQKGKPLCWFWKSSTCSKGASCPFRHELTPAEQMHGVSDEDVELCWYWTQNTCNKGDQCTFRHYYTEQDAQEHYGGDAAAFRALAAPVVVPPPLFALPAPARQPVYVPPRRIVNKAPAALANVTGRPPATTPAAAITPAELWPELAPADPSPAQLDPSPEEAQMARLLADMIGRAPRVVPPPAAAALPGPSSRFPAAAAAAAW